MGHRLRSNRRGLRRAIAASVALHLVIALAIVVAVRSRDEPTKAPGINTRADDVAVKMFADDLTIPVALEPTTPPPPAEPPSTPSTPPQPEPARTPHATTIPATLPPDVLNLIRRPTATTLRPPTPITDPNVKPAAATNAKPAGATTVPPMHGAMTAGKSVVYVLDCSGSMGEFGKLAVARAALVATLRHQSGEVRFQVIAYNTTARSLLPGACVPATAANRGAAELELAKLTAAGRSNHAAALRLAASLRPDVIVLLTDADDLSAASIKIALAGAGKTVPVCVAGVTGEGVAEPRELK